MIQYVLLDLDGVIRLYDNTELFDLEKQHNLPKNTFFSYCFESTLLNKAVTGLINDEEWKKEIKDTFEKDFPKLNAEEFVDTLWNSPFEINYSLFQLLKDQFPDAIYIIGTNATSRLNKDLKHINISEYISKIYNSSDIGVSKPDPSFFKYIQEDLKVPFSQIIYIDDNEKNISIGNELGMRSFLYKKGMNIALEEWLKQVNS